MTKITPYNSEMGAGACSPLFRKGYWVNIFNPIKNIGRTTQVKVPYVEELAAAACDGSLYPMMAAQLDQCEQHFQTFTAFVRKNTRVKGDYFI